MNNVCAHPLPMARQKILGCVWLMAPVQSFHHTAGKRCLDDERIPLIRSSFSGYVKLQACIFTIDLVQDIFVYSVNWFPTLSFLTSHLISRLHRAPHCGALAMSGASVVSVRSKGVWYDPTIPLRWTNGLGIKPLRRQTSKSTHPVRWVGINRCFSSWYVWKD